MILLKYKYYLLNLSTLNIYVEADWMCKTNNWNLVCSPNGKSLYLFEYSSEEFAQKAYDKIIDVINKYAKLGIGQDCPYIIDLNKEVIENE